MLQERCPPYEDYFDGNLKRYLKSEPIPESNDGPVKVRGSQGPQTPTGMPSLHSCLSSLFYSQIAGSK